MSPQNDIAIVGMAGRFPGASDIAEFEENIFSGVCSVRRLSDDQLDCEGVTKDQRTSPDFVPFASVLENADRFDAEFFGISRKEARLKDPQHRLLLETAWHALEHAGYAGCEFDYPVGVFTGVGPNDYFLRNIVPAFAVKPDVDWHQLFLGNDKDFASTFISYKLNLRGPSLSINTGCSSSLVCVHMAARSLLCFEADMALAGGASVSSVQGGGYTYREGGILAPDGACRPFDVDAGGTVPGSGVGVVVLKRLEDALRDRDTIYAVIKGSAINNDGARKASFTAPNARAQADVISEACAFADIDPASIAYVETHGTGTAVGDPVELFGLRLAFERNRRLPRRSCAIGSVKANIGHANAASGVAGLIKAVCVLNRRTLPPQINYRRPNPQLELEEGPFYVPTECIELAKADFPLRAGVSSFGIGGTNAHVVLEAWPEARDLNSPEREELLIWSAKGNAAADEMSGAVRRAVKAPDAPLKHIADTLKFGRAHLEVRRCAVVDGNGHYADITFPRTGCLVDAMVWMFPGQGAQTVAMASDLYQKEPSFAETMDRCCELLAAECDSIDWRALLIDEDYEHRDLIDQTRYCQPALFVVEYVLAQWWLVWGMRPNGVIGHSLGEYTAACVAGVLTLEDAIKVVVARGRLMQQLPVGAMLSAALSEQQLAVYCRGSLDIAAVNGAAMCVAAGDADEICRLERELSADGVRSKLLKTDRAFHSRHVDVVRRAFEDCLKTVRFNPPLIPLISNITGTWLTDEDATNVEYWSRHLRQPVRFADGLHTLATSEGEIGFLEVGPGSQLTTLARMSLGADRAIVSSSVGNSQTLSYGSALHALGCVWVHGIDVDWQAAANVEIARVAAPLTRFRRQRHWVSSPLLGPAARLTDESIYDSTTESLPVREAVHKEWRLALGEPKISGESNYYELGGDSLVATQIINRLSQRLGFPVPLDVLLSSPVFDDFVASLETLKWTRETAPCAEQEGLPLESRREVGEL